MKPATKALIVCELFAGIYIAALILTRISFDYALPLSIFYFFLLVNTYYSVRLFTAVLKRTAIQKVVDTILGLFYVAMAASIGHLIIFSWVLSIFFAVSTLKYILAANDIDHPRLLKYKMIVDGSGTLMGILTLGGILGGYPFQTVWGMTTVFTLATAYIFLIKPLYVPDR